MALHSDFPESPYAIINPSVRWLPDQSLLFDLDYGMLLPPLVQKIREQVKAWRDNNYSGASATSKALLNWWFNTPHPQEQTDGTMSEFQYYFAQREAIETIIYLYDVVKVRDEFDLMRFDSSGAVSANMFDENWRRFVIKMATGTGKTKVMSLAIAWSFFHKLYEQDSDLSRNFLVIAPNIIVLDRLYHDFQGLGIFFEDPCCPTTALKKTTGVTIFNSRCMSKTRYVYREYTNLADLDVTQLDFSPVTYQAFGEAEIREIVFKDMTTGEVTHTTVMDINGVADYRSVVGYFAETIRKDLRLVGSYDVLYGKVKDFVQHQLFGETVILEDPNTLQNLSELPATKTVMKTFKYAINDLTIQDRGDNEGWNEENENPFWDALDAALTTQ